MSSGERPIGAATGKQSDAKALYQSPPPRFLMICPYPCHPRLSNPLPLSRQPCPWSMPCACCRPRVQGDDAGKVDMFSPPAPQPCAPVSPFTPNLSNWRTTAEPFKEETPFREAGKKDPKSGVRLLQLRVAKSMNVLLTMLIRIFSNERLSLLYTLVSKGVGNEVCPVAAPSLALWLPHRACAACA